MRSVDSNVNSEVDLNTSCSVQKLMTTPALRNKLSVKLAAARQTNRLTAVECSVRFFASREEPSFLSSRFRSSYDSCQLLWHLWVTTYLTVRLPLFFFLLMVYFVFISRYAFPLAIVDKYDLYFSIFLPTCETLNIWTHLLPGLFLLVHFVQFAQANLQNWNDPILYPYWIFAIG